MSEDRQTRGEANHNPGNIILDVGTTWLGQVPRLDQTDPHFCQFDSDVHGIRALCRILVSYQRLDGCKTLADVIRRWAPPSENNTDAYLADVSQRTGLAADQPIDFTSASELATVARAIIIHENGRCVYDADLINRAANMALT